ncbi:MAG: ABC transporter ATP-binding protein [Clostridiales bacterium]|nr:ABC transporter ATP-binding protein [Clostridiales bacterium]
MLTCNNLTRKFSDGTYGLKSIQLHIKRGEFVAVVGKSGSGKSTLLNCLGLIDTPNEGTIIIDGEKVSALSQKEKADIRCKKIGYIFQNFFLEEHYSVERNVELPLIITGLHKKERKKRITNCLECVGMTHKRKQLAKNLSGGEKQRVCIARALSNQPEILLADEPCGNLDSENTNNIMKILTQLHQEGKTIVLVTHSLEEAEYADRKILMKDGMNIENEENYIS